MANIQVLKNKIPFIITLFCCVTVAALAASVRAGDEARAAAAAAENSSAGEKINAVNIDCTELEYISSAGLRVLLIMHKACPGGVTVSGANNAIKEILSQTGFDSILTLI